jgi:hypothetical protein
MREEARNERRTLRRDQNGEELQRREESRISPEARRKKEE